ncbi:site-specific integrase [Azospirillum sp. B506]|uniref:site-specific integrase n=1 Tax=Azospirillum sp. B506 TaxID=137721 RepID=UPI00034B825C|nr:site-specific integrase [Azospirillum sp. B506]
MNGDLDDATGDDRPASLPVPAPADPWLPGLLVADEVEAARRYVEAAMAPATLRAYANDWELYTRWCADRGLEPLPSAPAQVATFLAHQAELGLAVATIERRLAAIGHHHRRARLPAPLRDGGRAGDRANPARHPPHPRQRPEEEAGRHP